MVLPSGEILAESSRPGWLVKRRACPPLLGTDQRSPSYVNTIALPRMSGDCMKRPRLADSAVVAKQSTSTTVHEIEGIMKTLRGLKPCGGVGAAQCTVRLPSGQLSSDLRSDQQRSPVSISWLR